MKVNTETLFEVKYKDVDKAREDLVSSLGPLSEAVNEKPHFVVVATKNTVDLFNLGLTNEEVRRIVVSLCQRYNCKGDVNE